MTDRSTARIPTSPTTGSQPMAEQEEILNALRDILRNAPFGRITFANSDLAGIMDHRCSILEASRAVDQLMDQVVRD